MYVVDASVWVSKFVSDDTHHSASALWLDRLADKAIGIYVPMLALAEVAGAVARRTRSVQEAEGAVRLLLSLPIVQINPVDLDLGQASAQLAIDLRLRGADAIYVALARRLGMPLVTWDEEQRQRARSAVRVATPEEALGT